jgi:carbonic anhydrase
MEMQKLIQGIFHFQTAVVSSQRERFERLAHGQQPLALFITCSDSRINPNLITQTEPGELFILRNAGNIVPPYGAADGGEGATVEYAVEALGIKDIIVCGHSHCGAMTALLEPDRLRRLPAVAAWLVHARATRRIRRHKSPDRAGPPLLATVIEENVLVQMQNLRTHPAVARGLACGQVRLHGWVYHIETGEVLAHEGRHHRFVPLTQSPAP